ncbi:MAG: DM13 domain-containing protein [Chloroflexota bacterium]|nr:DM13 domain-containing protein [Chloroflexota bacterium]
MPSASAMMEHSAAPSVAGPVSTGTFHAVDGTAKGAVALFHKPDGTFAITFEDFSIASNAHTNVILVTNKDVTKDGDIDKTAIVDLGPLKGTTGMQDFVVPPSADAMTYHTVVLWDTEMTHPIAAAPLQ